ncbi:ARMS [Mytilus edulis]|uniref:KIDINS220 n=1 Tax=Mytilus edulis TaxID=6550 RepID=A0A8S3R6N5_MYTED|nr:ARMS [Mytilus edulis]
MTLILRHFHIKKAPVGGYDVLPPDQDQTPAADLARIKYYRNFIAHSKDGIIDDKGYKEAWRHLYDVVDRLGDAVLKQECELLGRADLNMAYKAQCEELSRNISKLTEHRTGLESRQAQLASDMTKQETILRQHENLIKQFIEDIRSENEATNICVEERMDNLKIQLDRVSECLNERESAIPRNSKEQIVQQIETWIEDEKKYVNIDASACALDLLKKSPMLTVAGNAGCGKTAFIRHLALRFMSQGYEIVPVIKPKYIVEYHDQTKKQVFVLDDACGVHHIDKKKCMAWMDNRLVIRNCLLQSGALLLVLHLQVEGFDYHPRNIMACFELAFKDICTTDDRSEKLVMKKLRSVIKPIIEKQFIHYIEYHSSEFPVPTTIFDLQIGCSEARYTYLSLAALLGHESIVNLLLLKGANPNEISIPSNTFAKERTSLPIVHAAQHGRLTIVQKLLKHGAKIESTGPMGCTLLMLASSYGHLDLVKFLLNEQVDINATNMFQNTALSYASKKGIQKLYVFFLNTGLTQTIYVTELRLTILILMNLSECSDCIMVLTTTIFVKGWVINTQQKTQKC